MNFVTSPKCKSVTARRRARRGWLRPALALLGACALSGMSAAAARADGQQYQLGLHLQAGQVWSFNDTIDGTSTMTAVGQNLQTKETMHTQLSGKLTINEVANGVPTSVTVAFDPNCSSQIQMSSPMGQQPAQNQQLPLAGQTITIRRDPATGQITNDFKGEADATTTQALQQMITPDTAYFADHPVSPGDKYDVNGQILLQRMNATDPNDRAGMHVDVLQPGTVDGRPTLELKVSSVIDRHAPAEQGGGELQVISQSVNDIDLASGQVLKTDSKVTMTGSGAQQGPDGQPHQMKLDSQITTHGDCKLVGGPRGLAAGGMGNAPAPAPAPSGENPPVPPPSNPSGGQNPAPANPFAPAASAAPAGPDFSGSFKDADTTLVLSSDGAGGYSGQIQFRGQTMPVTAKVVNDTLTGSFETQGAKFEFTAVIDGGALKFTTGGRTMNLQKDQTPKNPFAN